MPTTSSAGARRSRSSRQRLFAYTQVAGFVAEFCALGGEIVKRIWVPTPTPDNLAPYIAPGAAAASTASCCRPTRRRRAAFVNGVPQLHGSLARKIVAAPLLDPASPRTRSGRGSSGVAFGSGQAAYFGVPAPARPGWDATSRFSTDVPALAGLRGLTSSRVSYADAMEALAAGARDGQRRPLGRGAPLPGGAREGGARRAERSHPPRREPPGDRRQLPEPDPAREEGQPARPTTFKVVPNVEQTFGGYFRRVGSAAEPDDAAPARTEPAALGAADQPP